MNIEEIILPLDVDLPPWRKLIAGQLTCFYEMGNLRYIRFGEQEVVRMIYAAVRNENWTTIVPAITEENIQSDEQGFQISYTAVYEKGNIRYKADIEIRGNADSSISFFIRGEALSDFKRNRIGLCVHHPLKECVGREAIVTGTDGKLNPAVFPMLVSPEQVFQDIAGIQWAGEGMACRLTFKGDIFETEDQRNWSDGSFKTYGTPLSLPFPVEIKTGEKLTQQIILNVVQAKEPGTGTGWEEKNDKEQKIPFPAIGYSRGDGQEPLTEKQTELLMKIPFDHYHVEIDTTVPGWEKRFGIAAGESRLLQVPLEIAAFVNPYDEESILRLIAILKENKDDIGSLLPLCRSHKTTAPEHLRVIYPALKEIAPHIQIGYGTDANFAELNRARPLGEQFDFLCFSLNPQVHVHDSRSLLDNLESQAFMVETARSFCNGKNIHVGPITLHQRHNPDATNIIASVRVTPDHRQQTSFAARWTLVSLQQLSGASRLSFHELTGDGGIIGKDGIPSPLFEVLARIKDFQPVCIVKGANPSAVLVLENKQGERMVFR